MLLKATSTGSAFLGKSQACPLSLKAITSEPERLSSHALLAKGDGYFYFSGGDPTDWLDRTVRVEPLHLPLAR